MKNCGIIKYLKLFIFSLGAICCGKNVAAAEITAVDFNGDVIGQVISTGMVINSNGENVGYITADSLIVNEENNIVGGVVPQGVAIGMDNRFLGKINSDGIVRSATGKALGKALPNGLVIDGQLNVVGMVLFPGLVYSGGGKTIGRLTSAGTYTDLDGAEIGYISANGYAYRKTGEDYSLDGRLMSSKMVVSLTGEFIGSISPSGRVIDFEGKDIGLVHANEYVYSPEGRIIGRVVRTGYAFDLRGNYLGIITYNGTVVNGSEEMGKYRADGNIVDNKNNVIGFSVSLSATVNDNNGHYLGRVLPKGIVVGNGGIVGRVGARGFVYNQNNEKIGELVQTGPVFNALGELNGQSMGNGSYISLKGSPIGRMRGQWAFDSNGILVGGLTKNMLATSSINKPLGVVEIDSVAQNGADKQKVSPFGYVLSAENKLNGHGQPMWPVYGLEGQIYSYVTPNGDLYREMPNVQLNAGGVLTGNNGYIGSMFDVRYALGYREQNLGMFTNTNIILTPEGDVAYKITPKSYVVEADNTVSQNFMPLRGYAGSQLVAEANNGDLLGYTNSDGQIVDLSGSVIGQVLYGDYVRDNNNSVIGKVMPFAAVNNDKCDTLGIMNGRGEVVNSRDVAIGRLLPNGQAVSDVGSYIGNAVFASGIVDFNGDYAGTVFAGKGFDLAGKALGCINRQGIIVDGDNKWRYGVISLNPVIDFDNNIVGQVLENGSVVDNNNQILGAMQPDGNVISKSKKNIGNVMRYKVAFKNDNTFLGMVQNSGQIADNQGKVVGQINFDGSVQYKGETIGFALYDWYVYDDAYTVYGHILKDGTILNLSGSRLGKMDKGFVVGKNNQVVARGNRDYTIRDASNNVIGELQIDGNVQGYNNQNVGYLGEAGIVKNVSGDEIAKAFPLQYYQASENRQEPSSGRTDWADYKRVQIQQEGPIGNSSNKSETSSNGFNRRVIGIALNPDGDVIGNIYEDNKVYDENGIQKGFRTPDGMIVDMKYNPIGVEEVKNVSASNMFVPAGAFGSGNAYGIGSKPSSLGPGGGYGQGERYDPQKAAALARLQSARRGGMQVGSIKSNIKVSNFTGYEEDYWPEGDQPAVSTWRVDMSEMILQDKPIPAVLARSVYASEGLGSGIPVTAIVERNIFSEEGRNIIIPAGSRVIGSLGGDSGSSGGNSGGAVKIGITWKRLIRPDGSQFLLGDAQTADAQGRAGAIGYLDEQLLKKYTAPMLVTAMESATAYMMAAGEGTSTSENGSSTESSKSQAASQARENFLNQMDSIFQDIIETKSKIRSVTYIPAGTRIIIFPNRDMWLNSEKRRKAGGSDGKEGSDLGTGLTAKNTEEVMGKDSTSRGYSGEYDENIRPTGGTARRRGGSALTDDGGAAARQQQMRAMQQQQMMEQNGDVPATIQQNSSESSGDDVPALM